jgi:hypothetical protein
MSEQQFASLAQLAAGRSLTDHLQSLIRLWAQPAFAALFALLIYTIIASWQGTLWQASPYAYYNYLADAFLHGQPHLRLEPGTTHDLSLFNGRAYLYWSPLPAILLMPFVALFGVQFSDTLFNVSSGALNVGLVALLLRRAHERGVVDLTPTQRGLLTLFFAFGTVHFTLVPYGRVWFTGLLVAFCCTVLGYLASLSFRGYWAFALTGMAFAGALLTRNHTLLAGLWPAFYLLQQHWPEGGRRRVGYMIVGVLPVALAVGFLAVYNLLRFGSPFDNGLVYHQMSPFFVTEYQRYGVFHPHYAPTNFFYQYIAYPFPVRTETLMGGSLFLLSPVFFGVFWGITSPRRLWSTWMLVVAILLVATPIVLLMGTGWMQFGPRYTLDFTVPLLLLTASGIRTWRPHVLGYLTAISAIHYLLGVIVLGVALLGR